jgi:hypothetical protein
MAGGYGVGPLGTECWVLRRTELLLPSCRLLSGRTDVDGRNRLDVELRPGPGVDGENFPLLILGGIVGCVPLAPHDEPPPEDVGDRYAAFLGVVLGIPLPGFLRYQDLPWSGSEVDSYDGIVDRSRVLSVVWVRSTGGSGGGIDAASWA